MPTLDEIMRGTVKPADGLQLPLYDARGPGTGQPQARARGGINLDDLMGPPRPEPGQNLDIWNGMRQTTVPYSGAPATTIDHSAMVRNPNQPQLDLLQQLTDQARNNIPGGTFNAAWPGMQQDITQRAAGAMQNQLGTGRLGLDSMMQLGSTAANGARIPGGIENDATRAHAALLMAQNAPRAEDVQADATAMTEYNRLRATGMAHETAVADMQRNGQRLPRQFGGTPGSPADPPWVRPAAPSGAPGTPPLPAPATNPPAGSNGPPVAASDAVSNAFTNARRGIPSTPGQVGANGVIGPAIPQPYSGETATSYHNAITSLLSGLSDEQLRSNWNGNNGIQQRLLNEFGGPQALNGWLNQTIYTNPLTGNPMSGNPQTADMVRQIQRINRLAGNRMGPGRASGMMGGGLTDFFADYSPIRIMQEGMQGLRGAMGTTGN